MGAMVLSDTSMTTFASTLFTGTIVTAWNTASLTSSVPNDYSRVGVRGGGVGVDVIRFPLGGPPWPTRCSCCLPGHVDLPGSLLYILFLL